MLLPNNDLKSKLSALSSSQALIEFDLDGKVVAANRNFLEVMSYHLEEIQGQHHSLFVDPVERETAAYREFWAGLRRGEAQVAEFKRIGKGGREAWIQASYNPLRKRDGRLYGVFKCAADITAQKVRNADFEGKLKALDPSQGIIEFDLDGTVITANPNFLAVVGYGLDEVRGIGSQITETQSAANEAAAAIAGIGETIGQVNEISAAISSAIEQQAAVAQEMSANMQAMTSAVGEISQNVSLIASSTQEVDASARLVRDASRSMAV